MISIKSIGKRYSLTKEQDNFKSYVVLYFFLCYIKNMTITQTVEIPTNRRLIIDVPREVPTGAVILAFTPASITPKMSVAQELELINRHADRLNAEAIDVLSYQDIDL